MSALGGGIRTGWQVGTGLAVSFVGKVLLPLIAGEVASEPRTSLSNEVVGPKEVLVDNHIGITRSGIIEAVFRRYPSGLKANARSRPSWIIRDSSRQLPTSNTRAVPSRVPTAMLRLSGLKATATLLSSFITFAIRPFSALSAGLGGAGLSWQTSEPAHGLPGGFQSAISGQDFARGFVIGALSQVNVTSITAGYISGWAEAEQVAVSAVINGAISEAQGDKFANGALTGAFQLLYLDADQGQWQIKSVIEAANVLVSSVQPELGVGGIIGAVADIRQSMTLTNHSFVSGCAEVDSFLNLVQTGANDLTQLETAVDALKSKPPSPGLFPGNVF
jgi:hypothetical protein